MATHASLLPIFKAFIDNMNEAANSAHRNVLFEAASEAPATNIAVLSYSAQSIFGVNDSEGARIEFFVEETVPRYSDVQFRQHFRMDRSTFEELCQWICPHLTKSRTISVEKKILATLWIVGTTESFRSVGDRFGVNKGLLHKIVALVCNTLCELRDQVIFWPRNDQLVFEAEKFEARCGFPGVVGIVDGSYIRIPGPAEHRDSYICRKGFPAIHLQVVCNKDMMLVDVFTGWPGSVHDSRVLKHSPLWERLQSGLLPSQFHLLGDSAYPLTPFMMVPFRDNGHLTRVEKTYNSAHSSTRVEVEMCLGLLKNKFRRLRFLEMNQINDIPMFITAVCVLHNFILPRCGAAEDELEADISAYNTEDAIRDNDDEPCCGSAVDKRLQLAQQLF